MIEKIIFCFAFALQISAWILAGASIGFRARSKVKPADNGLQKARWNTVLFRRVCLVLGAAIVTGYALLCRDYVLLAGQLALLVVLWFRVALKK